MKRHEGKSRGILEISPEQPETGEGVGGGSSSTSPGRSGPSRMGGRVGDNGADMVTASASDQVSLAAKAFELSREGMLISDGDLRILHANRAFTEITGYALEDIVGKKPGFLKSGAHDKVFYRDMWTRLAKWGYWQGEIWSRRKNGAVFPAWLTISRVDKGNTIPHYVSSLSDITEKKRADARAEYLNLHDALTGLPSKAVFLERLSWSIASAQRRRQRLGVLALSLCLPETMASDAWDIVLKQAASRLLSAIRESDAVARFHEEELVVLLDELSSVHHAEWVAKKILWALRQPFTVVDRETRMDASIGIALFPQHDADATGLVNKAERAMNQVRYSNGNTFEIFDHQIFSRIG